jgi:cell division transport system permease protein
MEGNSSSTPRRFKPNYLYSVVSTSLVLFMIGILAMIFSSGNKLANQFKENLEFTIIIKDNVDEKSILALKDTLQKEPWVKSAVYVSKEEAAKIFTKDSGEEYKDLLDYNPLFASINLKLLSEYTSQDSINSIEKKVLMHTESSEFYYEHKLVEVLNDNLRKIGWFIIAISLLLIIIAVTLIDSTIRLSMYANRFLIRSMQLVGATRSFITKPFLRRSMINGIIASAIAIFLLVLLMKFATMQLPELKTLQDQYFNIFIFAGILIIGLLFSYLSTSFAVSKYLRMKLDELY